ncbi:MAG: hypothetical protein KAG66_21560 [Methylococcales bacterium]|nr:hypothetical protein [Methylococcales bacterium]
MSNEFDPVLRQQNRKRKEERKEAVLRKKRRAKLVQYLSNNRLDNVTQDASLVRTPVRQDNVESGEW